ncbi:hypothetical protein T02_2753 [Trichinella nativa]|uniref:Uncharacterized protein n=1 Tax=Trichinella nativa TaxID=6335 RepID=A0A0V1LIJ4_9BILA|nr:hypothetical protein T02_2753 [Trichinella nativa]
MHITKSTVRDISHFSLLKLRKTQCFPLAKTGNAPEATLLFVKHELASGYAVNRSHFCSASSSDNLSKLEFYAVLELQKMG